jgi:soluble lytic murein transglycosylase-like protein
MLRQGFLIAALATISVVAPAAAQTAAPAAPNAPENPISPSVPENTVAPASDVAAPTTSEVAPVTVSVSRHVRVQALSDRDETRYRAAFSAIDAHNWQAVRGALAGVDDDSLVGVVKGRMLLSRAYRPSYAELTRWLEQYRSLPLAEEVYDRAMDARPRRRRARYHPPQPISGPSRLPTGSAPAVFGDSPQARIAIARIDEAMWTGDFAGARQLALNASLGGRSGDANWRLGLMAYREHDYAEAVRRFESAAQWGHFGGWAQASVHYWAARSRLAAGEPEGVVLHLEQAALRPWTFYGQMAEAQLGRETSLDFTPPRLDENDAQRLLDRHAGARRAAALGQLGRLSDVEIELRRVHGELTPNEDRTYLALSIALAAPAAQVRAAEFGTRDLAAGFCPTTTFEPDGGFTLDRALVFAIVRQESAYNPRAVSPSRARGLMQLLPSTAQDLEPRGFRRDPTQLYDPGLNLRLGQEYVRWLMDRFHQDGDLAQVFAAYNGGPGWLSRWLATQPAQYDPLLLLEMLPRAESRDYAERVLSHMALCRKAYGQPTPELNRLASGATASYEALDGRVAAR